MYTCIIYNHLLIYYQIKLIYLHLDPAKTVLNVLIRRLDRSQSAFDIQTIGGPTEIKANDRIQVGDTELLFVALCGDDFDWQDNA